METADRGVRRSGDGLEPPLVSVIIAARNAEVTISETLKSVTAGTYRNIEIIVVDDGSTDRTAAVVQEMMLADPRIQLHRTKWRGVSAASNTGLAVARGEYVARLDADDLWHPTKIEKQIAATRADAAAAFIYTYVRSIDADGTVLHDATKQDFPRHALCRCLYENLAGANSSALIRRSVVKEVGGDEERLHSRQDLILQLRIFARHAVFFVPEYLVGYRVSPRSLSADPQKMLESWSYVRRKIEDEFRGIPSRVWRWADARRYVELAEGFAWRKQYSRATSLLFGALLLDPARTALVLICRIERRVRLKFLSAPAEDEREAVTFAECDPKQPVRRRERVRATTAELLERFEHKRIEWLTRVDERASREAIAKPVSPRET